MVGYTINSRGRYKCEFCDHTTYKTLSGIQTHLKDQHLHSLRLAEKDAEIERLKKLPPKVEIKERVVYRDPPAKPKKPQEYYYPGAGIYCEACKEVNTGAGIPVGQTIESTPHFCGNRNLKLVLVIK